MECGIWPFHRFFFFYFGLPHYFLHRLKIMEMGEEEDCRNLFAFAYAIFKIEAILFEFQVSTGQQNYHMLGHATANIEMTRGGREGNNALLCHDVGCSLSLDSQVEIFLEKNVSFTTLEHIASLDIPSCQGLVRFHSSFLK